MKKSNVFKKFLSIGLFVILFFNQLIASNSVASTFVNPFIGTQGVGHTFPAACVPFGMIQAGPDTGFAGWAYCSGYQYTDSTLLGFSQTHLNGTGCHDLGDLLALPFAGKKLINRTLLNKKTEKASAGYYAVTLPDAGVQVEITATEHVALHRYKFNNVASEVSVLIDFQHGMSWNADFLFVKNIDSHVVQLNDSTLSGWVQTNMWVNRRYYFKIQFNRSIKSSERLPKRDFREKSDRIIYSFANEKGKPLLAKFAMSAVSEAGASANLKAELAHWDFGKTLKSAEAKWDNLLGRVKLKGTKKQKELFYTSMYRMYIQPNNMADVSGEYCDAKGNICKSPSVKYFSTLSTWDTYRAAHPLYTLLCPEIVNPVIESMLLHADAQGYLPIWTLWGIENHCMIGNHSIPIITDAYLKGFKGFDAQKALKAMIQSSTVNHYNCDWDDYMRLGYMPFDKVKKESVSITLESAFDDYAVALMALKMNDTKTYEQFSKRALNYRNLFDTTTFSMRGKDSFGNWRSPFDALSLSHASSIGGDYTEANAFQYSFSVQHDIDGLVKLHGNKANFIKQLDRLFEQQLVVAQHGFVSDVSGLIGNYAHGNEPSHHIAYLYSYLGFPHKTEALIRKIFDTQYNNRPDGLCGNDDCGQMSAWYVFSALGFYPVNPCGGDYVLGAPQIPYAKIKLPNGKNLIVEAKDISDSNKYVKEITFNGKVITSQKITHQMLLDGGKLSFQMASVEKK